jgi:hypothetical protein
VQKIISSEREAKTISKGRLELVARTDLAAQAAPTVQGEVVSIAPAVAVKAVVWIARLRTGRVAIFQVSDSRDFSLGALIAAMAVEDSAVATASEVGVDSAAIALVAVEADLGAAASADSVVAAADSAVFAAAADDEN